MTTVEPPSRRRNREHAELTRLVDGANLARRQVETRKYVARFLPIVSVIVNSAIVPLTPVWQIGTLLGTVALTMICAQHEGSYAVQAETIEHRQTWARRRLRWLDGHSAVQPEEAGTDGIAETRDCEARKDLAFWLRAHAVALTVLYVLVAAANLYLYRPHPEIGYNHVAVYWLAGAALIALDMWIWNNVNLALRRSLREAEEAAQ